MIASIELTLPIFSSFFASPMNFLRTLTRSVRRSDEQITVMTHPLIALNCLVNAMTREKGTVIRRNK